MNKIFINSLAVLGVIGVGTIVYADITVPIVLEEETQEAIEEVRTMVVKVYENTEPVVITENVSEYRLTSYYTDDSTGSGKCTGSGLCVSDFKVNEQGWYTYQGKLVMAAATNECLNSHYGACNSYNTKIVGRHYFDYYDEVTVVIDNIEYTAIILDSCGASMYIAEDRLDLFVSGSNHFIDRGYLGNNPITVTRIIE